MSFQDKVVIVTGSSSGIGAVAAQHFAKESAKVVLVARTEEKLREVAKAVKKAKGIEPLIVKADLSKDNDAKKVIEETVKKFGKIDVLVNNAGFGVTANVLDGIEKYDQIMAVNLRSVYLLTGLAVPHLAKTKGNIVNVSSILSIRGVPDLLPYSISKAGLDNFTQTVAKGLGPQGIRVNSVNPGPVKTNFHEAAGYKQEEVDKLFTSRMSKAVLGRFADTDDIAEAILFLASEKSKSTTGSILFVDGGDTLN